MYVLTSVRERGDFSPSATVVGTLPEAVSTPGAQEEDASLVWIDREPFSHTPAWHVTADLEGQCNRRKGLPVIGGFKNSAIVGIPKTSKCSEQLVILSGLGSYHELV